MVNFLKYTKLCFLFSFSIVALFLGTYIYKYYTHGGTAFNYSVDFTGGTQLLLKFNKDIKSSEINSILEKKGYKGILIREFSSKEFIIRIKETSSDVKQLGEKISNILEQKLNVKINIEQIDSISSSMGQTLRTNSIYAVLISLICMLFYVAIRFRSFAFAAGALAALFHDSIVILAYLLLFNKEVNVNVIGAILVVLGYSINDTIVIFSQIRDNIKNMPDKSIEEITNIALNKTLGRTIKTTISTALVVISLVIFGGQTLSDLSIALLIGIIFGTYSSIYLASPIMIMLYKKSKKDQKALA